MNILRKSGELNMKAMYDLCKSPDIEKMSSIKGQTLEIESFLVYEDSNTKDGTLQTIVSIHTPDGETFATNSPTFCREFSDLLSMCEESGEPYPQEIMVKGMTSKAGREFITCVYIR